MLLPVNHLDHAVPAQVAHSMPQKECRTPFHVPTPKLPDHKSSANRRLPTDPLQQDKIVTAPPAPAIQKVVTVHDRMGPARLDSPKDQPRPSCINGDCRAIQENARSDLYASTRRQAHPAKAHEGTSFPSIRIEKFPGSDKILSNVYREVELLNGQLKSPVKAEEIRRIIKRQIRRWGAKGIKEEHIQKAVEVNLGESIEMIVERSLNRIKAMVREKAQKTSRLERRKTSRKKRQTSPLDETGLLAQEERRFIKQKIEEQEREHREEASLREIYGNSERREMAEKTETEKLTEKYPEAVDPKHAKKVEDNAALELSRRYPKATRQAVAEEEDLPASYPEFYTETEPETARGTILYEPTPRKTTKINLS
jgi:hypothetical protein